MSLCCFYPFRCVHLYVVCVFPGMLLSVFVVLLFTVLYELLKVWKLWLMERSLDSNPASPQGSNTALTQATSETSLPPAGHKYSNRMLCAHLCVCLCCRWVLLYSLQAAVHVVQVTLGYMLMLCVMSYNVWIFLGVIVGSGLGYFVAFPLLRLP
ncbi:COPT2 protein, partial [Amia calva]|nr:COPT2 protein [Amia calva]